MFNQELRAVAVPQCITILRCILQVHLKYIHHRAASEWSTRQLRRTKGNAGKLYWRFLWTEGRQKRIHLHSFPLILSISTQSHRVLPYHYVPRYLVTSTAGCAFETISIEVWTIVSCTYSTSFIPCTCTQRQHYNRYPFHIQGVQRSAKSFRYSPI